jgi:hypothetical protein
MFLTNSQSIIFYFFPSFSFLPFSVFLSHLYFLSFLLFHIVFIYFLSGYHSFFLSYFVFPSLLFTFFSAVCVSLLFYYFLFSLRKLKLGESLCLFSVIYKLFPPHYIADLILMSYTYSTSFPDFSEKRCCKTAEKPTALTPY